MPHVYTEDASDRTAPNSESGETGTQQDPPQNNDTDSNTSIKPSSSKHESTNAKGTTLAPPAVGRVLQLPQTPNNIADASSNPEGVNDAFVEEIGVGEDVAMGGGRERKGKKEKRWFSFATTCRKEEHTHVHNMQ
mmetsp:Transcript_30326/g.63365  ORF Transcript_30326/g.63365 Transcript_30326/m.63365 type:complete len:135 (-) Transcript_30326:1298-1702(-)